jgi:hypothetical protein
MLIEIVRRPEFLILVLNIVVWSGIIFQDGIIINRDFNYPIFSANLERRYFPLWNDITSQPNIESLPRLVLFSPYLFLVTIGIQVAILLKLIIISTFSLCTFTFLFFMKSFLNFSYFTQKHSTILSVIGAFFFAYNPVMMQFAGAIPILISLSMLPLLLFLIITRLNSKYFPVYTAVILILSLGHPFIFIINLLVGAAFAILLHHSNLRQLVKKFVLTAVLFSFLSAWLWLPYFKQPIGSSELGRQEYLGQETFDVVSSNEIYKVFLLERDRFRYVDTEASESSFRFVFHYGSLGLALGISFSVLVFGWGTPHRMTIYILCAGLIVFSLLALGSKGPLGGIYYSLISGSAVGWIFRSPLKFQLYQAFIFSVLYTVGIALIQYKFQNYNYILYALVSVSLVGGLAYGLYDANTKSFNPIKLPTEYYEINSIVQKINNGSKVIYYPVYDEVPTLWSEGHRVGPFDTRSSLTPTYDIFTNYNFVRDNLYDIPYFSGVFNSKSFYDYLLSLNIKFIVFHNDRLYSSGHQVDQANLLFLLNSPDLLNLYKKNGWYLFAIKERGILTTDYVRAINQIIFVENVTDIYKASSPYVATVAKTDRNIIPEFNTELRTTVLTAGTAVNRLNQFKYIGLSLGTNYGLPPGWIKLNDNFKNLFQVTKGLYQLSVSTNLTREDGSQWSGIVTAPIDAKPDQKYLATIYVKTQNVNTSYINVQGYDSYLKKWVDLTNIVNIDGNSERKLYWQPVYTSSNMTMLRYVINAGSKLEEGGPQSITWIDSIGLYSLQGTAPVEGKNISFHKINPYLWEVRLNSTQPVIVAFSEIYDEGWVLKSNNYKTTSFRLYDTVNGFYINNSGEIHATIEYEPQSWFYFGTIITLLALSSTLLIVFFCSGRFKLLLKLIRVRR